MINIDPKYILAYIFLERDQITYEELRKIETHIEKNNPDVYVDMTDDRVCDMVDTYPHMFKFIDDWTVGKKEGSAEYFTMDYINAHFYFDFPWLKKLLNGVDSVENQKEND